MKKGIIFSLLCLSVGIQAMDKAQQSNRAPKPQTLTQRIVRPFIPKLKTTQTRKRANVLSHNPRANEVSDQNQEIYLRVASRPVRNFAQQIIQDPKVIIGVTNDPDQVAFATYDANDTPVIAFQEDLAIKTLSSRDGVMVTPTKFAGMIAKTPLHEDLGILRKTSTHPEIKSVIHHEDTHRVERHSYKTGSLYEALDNNKITREEFFAASRRMEEEADDGIYEKGSPRTIIGSECFFQKLAIIEDKAAKQTGQSLDETYNTHPLSRDRAAKATKHVEEMMGWWSAVELGRDSVLYPH